MIRAIDLEHWADSREAQGKLPQVVRRLIHATVESITRIEFSADEGIQRHGWDGIVDTPVGNAFVPVGISAWELGTGQDPRKKAQEDFQKRIEDPLSLDTRQVSFVFVTPRKWHGKADWCKEKNDLGIWKEVRVYDSANLEEWLETAPAVDVWLARLIGKRPPGVTDIAEHWENLAALTEPSLRPEVFLVNRKKETEVLSAWLSGSPTALVFEARSPVEVIDFFAAYLATIEQPQREAHEARILIVEQQPSANLSAVVSTNNSSFK